MRLRVLLTLAFLLAASRLPAAAAPAEPKLSDLPGYIPIEELGLFSHQELSIEINLDGPLLRLVGESTRKDDPDFSRLVAELKAIRVRVVELSKGEAAKVGAEALRGQLKQAAHWLESRGWNAIVRVHERTSDDFIYTRQNQEQIVGLAVLHFEAGEEAALVNIVGRFDPAQLGRLGRDLDLAPLKNLPDRPGKLDKKDKPQQNENDDKNDDRSSPK
jgi:hypothetical protein